MMPTRHSFFVDQAHRTDMPSPLRALIEHLLPWFDPARERQRNRRTEAIRLRSIHVRIRAERAIAQYRDADRRR